MKKKKYRVRYPISEVKRVRRVNCPFIICIDCRSGGSNTYTLPVEVDRTPAGVADTLAAGADSVDHKDYVGSVDHKDEADSVDHKD